MTGDRTHRDASSTSRRRPSPPSPRSARASSTSASPGSASGLGRAAVRDLASRHGIRPSKALGQNFLVDPNLARAIATEAGAAPRVRIVEVGAGVGSLTVALAAAGAEVLAIEFDRTLVPALRETTTDLADVRVLEADAMKLDWSQVLGEGSWTMASNLPYNIAVPLVAEMLERAPGVGMFVVMVQREVGERLAAKPGEDAYGAVSVRIAYRAIARVVRRIPPTVFWPAPKVESVLVRIERLPSPPVGVEPSRLWPVIDEGFAQRRKTMRSALRRLGCDDAEAVLASCGVERSARAESLGLADFARIAEALDG